MTIEDIRAILLRLSNEYDKIYQDARLSDQYDRAKAEGAVDAIELILKEIGESMSAEIHPVILDEPCSIIMFDCVLTNAEVAALNRHLRGIPEKRPSFFRRIWNRLKRMF